MSRIIAEPSVRADGRFDYLIPDGWGADEWRGGNCAALVMPLPVDGVEWEVCILPDGDLSLPRTDLDHSTWEVHANLYDEERNGEWILGVPNPFDWPPDRGPIYHHLTLPAYDLGEDFPTDKVLRWVEAEIRAGRVILV